MKTAIQELQGILEAKILPCNDDNSYVYGLNVAYTNVIKYMIPYLLQREKEQIIEAYNQNITGFDKIEQEEIGLNWAEDYYNQTYNQNK
jgi:hypothetical protein